MVLGLLVQFLVMLFDHAINVNPDGISFGLSLIYLLFARPAYTFGFALFMLPLIL